MKKAKKKRPTDKPIIQIKNLIQRFRATLYEPSSNTEEHSYTIWRKQWGGISFGGDEGRLYRECLTSLLAIHGNDPEHRRLSVSHATKLLDENILWTLRPGTAKKDEPREKFEQRLKIALRRIRKGLELPDKPFQLTICLTGFSLSFRPFMLGRIKFSPGRKNVISQIIDEVYLLRKPAKTTSKAARNKYFQEQDSKLLRDMFHSSALAQLEVMAADLKAAQIRGAAEVRLATDTLNFFAPLLFGIFPHRAYLAPEATSAPVKWLVYSKTEFRYRFNLSDKQRESPIRNFNPETRAAKKIGLDRVHRILNLELRSELEQRILTSISWAGKARAAVRRDTAFLYYAIALEALFAKPQSRGGVTERLKLRLAHTIGKTADVRRRVADAMENLYKLRSDIVHIGGTKEIGDSDLKTIEQLTETAIITMLVDKRFTEMREPVEFDQWFKQQLLAGAADRKPRRRTDLRRGPVH